VGGQAICKECSKGPEVEASEGDTRLRATRSTSSIQRENNDVFHHSQSRVACGRRASIPHKLYAFSCARQDVLSVVVWKPVDSGLAIGDRHAPRLRQQLMRIGDAEARPCRSARIYSVARSERHAHFRGRWCIFPAMLSPRTSWHILSCTATASPILSVST
jgi:hypothetical protein